ncbi:hypothetical protein EYB25_002294 [Talaromyces marneffei]|uniref:Uncharacterized protein n=1 Tax=Talaromyces marneffei (strain ATCC 18224 / CBS 334.59 / QM 7333) TaxID=441960 RepID=B6Q7C8_TALMQ|nr:uncharacterized protein EYB26_000043 [Talaromyces marneffei]EEA26670.1 hypothetical protein PMAA_015920 [Talaromyces marneffei ATCC 18224]KAE8557587.1 hypothetical protein EYB25_002294 [Talaromyces marneffei]QGA12399.1 hypothetical protein EYB26_000043 [Talaromyces marneffei]
MAVHIFVAEDSDGDSWLEVVEGSPGPSMQNSIASLRGAAEDKVDSRRRTTSWVEDDTWVSDFEDYGDTKRDSNAGKDESPAGVEAESIPPSDCTEHESQLVTNHPSTPNPAVTEFDQKFRLDRPEVGDITRHFNDVQMLATVQPRRGLYYRLWLCWMYRMEWSQIEHTVQNAPDYIIQVLNYLFGLRNHPFWTASDKCPYQWYAMFGACLEIWKWWDQQNADVEVDSDKTMRRGESSKDPLATHTRHRGYELPPSSQDEHQYSTFYGRIIGIDSIRPDSSTTLQLHEYTSVTPWQVSDDLSFVTRTYKAVVSPHSDQTGQGVIPFPTWIQWMHQVNLHQPSSKQWAGHDIWPSSSSSALPLTPNPASPSVALKNIGGVAYAYVEDIGLPCKAAAYYQSVSYI